jgi:hypothetical protein
VTAVRRSKAYADRGEHPAALAKLKVWIAAVAHGAGAHRLSALRMGERDLPKAVV